jgi:SAM-dependent methyltransferase
MTDDIARYLEGDALYGDDFSPDEVARWYADEAEAYAQLRQSTTCESRPTYEYHALNHLLGFSQLPAGPIPHVLGFGSAHAEELRPVLQRIRRLTVVDSSRTLVPDRIDNLPVAFVKATVHGALPLEAASVDLITCFGVLHHIPNVTTVVGELSRVLVSGGHLLLREPIVSMGDWREPREGLTPHERGIPLRVLDRILCESGFELERRTLCGFPLTERFFRLIRSDVYNSSLAVRVDRYVSAAFAWNVNYHRRTLLQRLRPTSVFVVALKR